MVTIFAARDQRGVTRFIGDVERGSACQCVCLVCGSPLVAKKADELAWHFAHVAGQERPECPAGALNLLRRLAIEELERLGTWPADPYCVSHPLPGRGLVCWSVPPAGPLQVLPSSAAGQPGALQPLQGGLTAAVHVCLGREAPPSPSGPDEALAMLWCPTPDETPIRSEADAREFVRGHMRLRWIHLPDALGHMAAAAREAAQMREQQERLKQARARDAGARWAAQRQAMLAAAPPVLSPGEDECVPTAGNTAFSAMAASVPSWAPGLLPGGAIHYRALDDGTRWVCYPVAVGQYRLCPVPEAQEGWNEVFPSTVAVPEGDQWLRVVDFGKLLLLFNRHATESHVDSDVAEIAKRINAV